MMKVNGWGISVLSVQESERRARRLQGQVSSGTCVSAVPVGGASCKRYPAVQVVAMYHISYGGAEQKR